MHSCDQSMMHPIAEINDEVITLNSYINKYKEYMNKIYKIRINIHINVIYVLQLGIFFKCLKCR